MKYFILSILLTVFSSASFAVDCTPDSLIDDLALSPELADAINNNVDLVDSWKVLDDLGETVLRKDSDFLKKFDDIVKNEGLNKHVFEGDVKVTGINAAGDPIYKITGVHSSSAFTDGTTRIKPNTDIEDLGNGYYKAKVEKQIDGFVNAEGTSWKVKSEKSTFFPDSWDAAKIQKEVTVALSNKVKQADLSDGRTFFKGIMSDGTSLAIYEENGIITTVFPSFN
jgi:hypothetical protein